MSQIKPMSEQAVRMHRESAKPSPCLRHTRDLWYFVTDLDGRPLLAVNAWGDYLEVFVNDPWNGVRRDVCTTIPYGASVRDVRMLALEVASDDFDIDRDRIMLTGMGGKVLCK